MPLITPNSDESRDEFLSRCVENETMRKEFPDQKQLLAVCGNLYDNQDDYERATFAIVSGHVPSQRLVHKFRSNKDGGEKLFTWEVEVFAVGTWNGYPFKKEDLEAMVESYKTLNSEGVLDAPLKFGHNDDQPMTDGYPALGWIDELFIKDGEDGKPKLWARFSDVPEIVYNAAKSKRYRKVSIELEFDVKHKGRMFPYVVTGIALLGADLPAVNTLADLNAYMGRDPLVSSRREVFSTVPSNIKPERKAHMAEIDDKELEELRKRAQRAEDAEAQAETFRKAEEDRKVKDARDTVNGILDKAVTDLQITPAQKAAFSKVLKVDDDAAVLGITPADIEALLPEKKTDTGSETFGRNERDETTGDTDDRLDAAAKRIVAESGGKVKYGRALEMAMAADPDVASQHLSVGKYANDE